MQKINHPLKARMFVGGLKSLLIGIVETLDEIEKTGQVPKSFVEELGDVNTAINLTLTEFKKVTIRCCEYGSSHDTCDESCEDEPEDTEDDCCDDEDVLYCAGCDKPEDKCVCDEEDEEEPPMERRQRNRAASVKKVEAKVVIPVKKKGK